MSKYAVDCVITVVVELDKDDPSDLECQQLAYQHIQSAYGDKCALDMYYSEAMEA